MFLNLCSLGRNIPNIIMILHSSISNGKSGPEQLQLLPDFLFFTFFSPMREFPSFPQQCHPYTFGFSESHIVVPWESLLVCVRGAGNQLCSPGEGTALLADPFKSDMVERVEKVGRKKYKTYRYKNS